MAITIRELARKAGVSTATVSLALRNHPRISETTTQQIHALADREGYKPDPVVSELTARVRAARTVKYQSTLSAVLTSTCPAYNELETVRDWLNSCQVRAHQLGYHFDCFSFVEKNLTAERVRTILESRGIRGTILVGPFLDNQIPRKLAPIYENFTTIVVGERPVDPPLPYVCNNQYSTAFQAVAKVAELDYRRPALSLQKTTEALLEHRFTGGYLAGMRMHYPEDTPRIFDFQYDARESFANWMETQAPDVILTLEPEIRNWAKQIGKTPGFVHLDLKPSLRDWAGMHQNNDQVGYAAIDMLVGLLHGNETGVPPIQKAHTVNSRWMNGETLHTTQQGASVSS